MSADSNAICQNLRQFSVIRLQHPSVTIGGVLQVYRVIGTFEAKQVDREPLRVETFRPGDLLVVLTDEDSYITFSRHDESLELTTSDRFIIGDWEFRQYTEPGRGAGS